MFVQSIEAVNKFTRPIHTIERKYNSKTIRPGAATLFFVNEEAVAVTCRHVAEIILQAGAIKTRYDEFKNRKDKLHKGGNYNKNVKLLCEEYGFSESVVCELYSRFMNCAEGFDSVTITTHPVYDVAIVRFENAQKPAYTSHAVFKKDTGAIKPGTFLCRLGFPFPEFNNYQYNDAIDQSVWTETGTNQSPVFPLEGMVTRFLGDKGKLVGIELSTPGLRGQSGGPLFDANGIIYGMQSATNHLHLGFDMKSQEIMANGEKIKVTNQPFLHVGHCVHVDVIKEFLTEHKVKFYEG